MTYFNSFSVLFSSRSYFCHVSFNRFMCMSQNLQGNLLMSLLEFSGCYCDSFFYDVSLKIWKEIGGNKKMSENRETCSYKEAGSYRMSNEMCEKWNAWVMVCVSNEKVRVIEMCNRCSWETIIQIIRQFLMKNSNNTSKVVVMVFDPFWSTYRRIGIKSEFAWISFYCWKYKCERS